jgi:hypothetical protein
MRHAEGRRQADLQRPDHRPIAGRDAGDGGLDALQLVGERKAEGLAGFRQDEPAGRAVEQADAEVSLQHRHVATDRGRRQRQPACRFGEAAVLRAAEEGFQVRQGLHTTILKQHLKMIQIISA